MPTLSIEVLCVGAKNVVLPKTTEVGLDISFPAHSDREPSLWQNEMNEIGGALIHIFDPIFIGRHRRWAYNIIIEDNWKDFRFAENAWPSVSRTLRSALEQSPDKLIIFYSDAQWSNDLRKEKPLKLAAFEEMHRGTGIRMNTSYELRP